MAKNPRAHPLQSPVPNLQFPAVFPAHVLSRTLHHPANPLYSIIILSHPFSTPFTSQLVFSTAPRLWNDLPPELLAISLPPPPSLPITRHHLHPAPLSITPGSSTQS